MPALTFPFHIHFLILMQTQILGRGCAETRLGALWEAFLTSHNYSGKDMLLHELSTGMQPVF